MGYFLADSTGPLDEFASIGGLADFNVWASSYPGPIRQLSLNGYTRDLEALEEALRSAKPFPNVAEQVELLRQHVKTAKDLLIISDGTSDEEPEPRTLGARTYPLLAIADESVPSFKVALNYAFFRAFKAYKQGGVEAALQTLEKALTRVVKPTLLDVAAAGGKHTAHNLFRVSAASSPLNEQKPTFRGKDPNVLAWAEDHAAELVQGITETTRDQLRFVISRLLDADMDLSSKEAVEEIAAAIGDDARAEKIARTETMRAVHEGQRQAWNQAVEDGVLPQSAKRMWITTPDDHLCDECLSLDGTVITLGDEYSPGVDAPPAHPNCRCTEGLVG